MKFIDSYRFMSTSFPKLVNNLSEGLHNDRCLDCKSCLDYMTTNNVKRILLGVKRIVKKTLIKN